MITRFLAVMKLGINLKICKIVTNENYYEKNIGIGFGDD